MSIGRYPVPALTAKQYAHIFNKPIDEIVLSEEPKSSSPSGRSSRPGGGSMFNNQNAQANSPGTMAIFELLDYIVNEVR